MQANAYFIESPIVTLLCLLVLSGCALFNDNNETTQSLGEYYLSLKQLSPDELTHEVKQITKTELKNDERVNSQNQEQQALHQELELNNTKIKLILLHSLPNSPIYNSFKAKELLNQLKQDNKNQAFSTISPQEQAFISILTDQLNQQLLLRNKLAAQELQRKEKQQQLAQQQQKQLREEIKQLKQTISQLQKIEQAINNREQ